MMDKSVERKVKVLSVPWLALWVLATLLMAGCTTTTTLKKHSVDMDKVVQNRLQLALGYMSKGDHERARDNLNKAMEVNSHSPELHDVWALLFQREMEYKEAEAHYKKALSYDPEFTRGRNNYGLFLMRLNRYEEAYQQFSLGTADLGYPKRAELFYKTGVAALKLDKLPEAESAFTRAAVLNPKLSFAYLELAELSFKKKDYQRAMQLLNKYNDTKNGPSPRGLWLGVRLEHNIGNQDAEASQGLALRNMFPNSRENQEYQSWLKNEQEK